MFYYVYILQSLRNSSLYIGYTSDLKKRIKEHNSDQSQATKPFIPYKLIINQNGNNVISGFINLLRYKKYINFLHKLQ